MRRTLLIIAAVLLILALGVGAYFALFAHKAKLSVGQGGSLPQSGTAAPGSGTGAAAAQSLGVPLPNAGTDVAPRLVRITDQPVALGSVAVFRPGLPQVATTSASSTAPASAYEPDVAVDYVERQSGNVYEYLAHARTLTRLSNKTLPGIEEASWLTDGSLAFVRFLDTSGGSEHVSTYALPKTGDGGYFLEQDLSQVAVHGTSTLMTLLSTTDGSSASVSAPAGGGLHTLFSSPISGLLVAFLGSNYIATTKASYQSRGYSFIVDPKNGQFTRILGPLPSLTTLPSPSGRYVLYGYLDRGTLALAVVDLTGHTATRLPLSTIADKCAWTSDSSTVYCGIPTSIQGNEPDDWYQGAVSFSDRLWRIDLASRTATLVIDPKQAAGTDMDMEGLSVDSTNDVLIFTDKRTGDLYAYDL